MSYREVNHGFYIDARLLNNGNNSYNISEYIETLSIRKRFIEDSFPLVVMDIRTTEELRDIMRDQRCSVSLRVSYYENNNSNGNPDELDNSDPPEVEKIFDGIIRIYSKPYATSTSKKRRR